MDYLELMNHSCHDLFGESYCKTSGNFESSTIWTIAYGRPQMSIQLSPYISVTVIADFEADCDEWINADCSANFMNPRQISNLSGYKRLHRCIDVGDGCWRQLLAPS